jgi:16S rRNA (uracil1498-N3)-methyltransferase
VSAPRLHLDRPLARGAVIELEGPGAHYLTRVLRLRAGAALTVFNGRDGEFAARLAGAGRHSAELRLEAPLRAPAAEPGPTLHFAPVRQSRLDWLVEKAVELGAARLVPVLTERTMVKLAKVERLRAIAVEAAEQCGRLTVPELAAPQPLAAWLDGAAGRRIYFADERGTARPLLEAARVVGAGDLLIGPEGGFTAAERALLLQSPGIVAVTLGPRILRSETAALAGLAILGAASGDADG